MAFRRAPSCSIHAPELRRSVRTGKRVTRSDIRAPIPGLPAPPLWPRRGGGGWARGESPPPPPPPPHTRPACPGARGDPGKAPQRAVRHLGQVPGLGSRALFFPLSRSARGSSPSTAGLPGPRRPRVPRSAPRARSSESRRARPPRPTRRAREPGRLRSPRAVRACPRPKSAPSGAGAPPALPARPGAGQPATPSAQRRARLRSRTHRLRAAGAPPPAGGPPAARARPRSAGGPWLRGASASAAKAMWPVVRSGGLGRPSLAPPRCAALRSTPPRSPACGRVVPGSALRHRSSSWPDLSPPLSPPPLPASAPASAARDAGTCRHLPGLGLPSQG